MMNKISLNSNKYIGKSQLATLWGCSLRTLSIYIEKIKDQIPFYAEGQRTFAPVQYKKIAALLGFDINPEN